MTSGSGDLAGAGRAWETLGSRIRVLLDLAGLGPTQFANKHQLNKSSVTRYCAGERLPSWSFMELLLTEAETTVGRPLADDLRQTTLSCYRNVLDLGRHPELREILDLTAHVQQLTAELSRAYYEIHRLETRPVPLQPPRDPEPAETGADLRRARLEASRLKAQRDFLRTEIAIREAELPTDTRDLYDADLPVPTREPTPAWWPHPLTTEQLETPPDTPAPRHRRALPVVLSALATTAIATAAVLILLAGHPTSSADHTPGTNSPSTAHPTPPSSSITPPHRSVPTATGPTSRPSSSSTAHSGAIGGTIAGSSSSCSSTGVIGGPNCGDGTGIASGSTTSGSEADTGIVSGTTSGNEGTDTGMIAGTN